jgi:hypothetical protein
MRIICALLKEKAAERCRWVGVAFSDAALIAESPVDGHVYELPSDVAISAAAVARDAMADPY